MINNKEKLNLTPKDFSFICPITMDELTPIEGGYHCDSCEKKVYDVSHMTKDEFSTLQKKTKDLCVSFQKVTTVAVALSTSGWIVADDITKVPFTVDKLQIKKVDHKKRRKLTKKPLTGFIFDPNQKNEHPFKTKKDKSKKIK